MKSKIYLGVISIILSFFIRKPCSAQGSYCTSRETQKIVNQVLASGFHSKNQDGLKNTPIDDYTDSLTKEGLEKLKTTKSIIALKTYSVGLYKKLDNNNYEKSFNDYFYFNDIIFSYIFFEKKAIGNLRT